jgi:DNA polymerase elongation subunit (family B)
VSSKILEGALLTYLRRRKLVAPNKKAIVEVEKDDELDNDVGFEGAYVKDPVPGRYEWICSADINSLYPSVIMSLNISPETKLGVIKDWDSENLVKKTADKIVFDDELYTYEDFSQLLIDNNLSVSANGVVYEQNKVGCIPDILKKWFTERKEFQGKMRDADKSGDKAGYVFWKRRQQVQKILLNSLYGVLGLKGWRFYDVDNASAVTLTGQEIIKTSAKYVNSQFNKRCSTKDKDYVVYIDTDSVTGDAKLRLEDEQEISISEQFDLLKRCKDNYNVVDITGREFIFPKNLRLPYYDEKNGAVRRGGVKYIERHRVKKKLYKITTSGGKTITVTGDHSVMILTSENKVKKMLAKDVKTGMSVIVI